MTDVVHSSRCASACPCPCGWWRVARRSRHDPLANRCDVSGVAHDVNIFSHSKFGVSTRRARDGLAALRGPLTTGGGAAPSTLQSHMQRVQRNSGFGALARQPAAARTHSTQEGHSISLRGLTACAEYKHTLHSLLLAVSHARPVRASPVVLGCSAIQARVYTNAHASRRAPSATQRAPSLHHRATLLQRRSATASAAQPPIARASIVSAFSLASLRSSISIWSSLSCELCCAPSLLAPLL